MFDVGSEIMTHFYLCPTHDDPDLVIWAQPTAAERGYTVGSLWKEILLKNIFWCILLFFTVGSYQKRDGSSLPHSSSTSLTDPPGAVWLTAETWQSADTSSTLGGARELALPPRSQQSG